MKSVILLTNEELYEIMSCSNSASIIVHKDDKVFIDSEKAYNGPLINKNYELTRQITNITSKFHPHLVELVVDKELK